MGVHGLHNPFLFRNTALYYRYFGTIYGKSIYGSKAAPAFYHQGDEVKAVVKHFNMEKASIKGFCAFCKNNIPLIIAVSLTLFFVYDIQGENYNSCRMP